MEAAAGHVLLQLTPLLAPLRALVRCVPRHLDLAIWWREALRSTCPDGRSSFFDLRTMLVWHSGDCAKREYGAERGVGACGSEDYLSAERSTRSCRCRSRARVRSLSARRDSLHAQRYLDSNNLVARGVTQRIPPDRPLSRLHPAACRAISRSRMRPCPLRERGLPSAEGASSAAAEG